MLLLSCMIHVSLLNMHVHHFMFGSVDGLRSQLHKTREEGERERERERKKEIKHELHLRSLACSFAHFEKR
jgi:hypothetical protein